MFYNYSRSQLRTILCLPKSSFYRGRFSVEVMDGRRTMPVLYSLQQQLPLRQEIALVQVE